MSLKIFKVPSQASYISMKKGEAGFMDLRFTDLDFLLFLHYLHIVYIGISICISTLRNNVRNKDNKKLRN